MLGTASKAIEWRTEVYGLLRLIMAEGPTQQSVSAIVAMGLLGKGFDPSVNKQLVDKLREEFNMLFAPPSPLVPNGADHYLVRDDPLVQTDLSQFYDDAGFQPRHGSLSIATELEFLHLTSSTIYNLMAKGERQRALDLMRVQFTFLRSHATQWIPAFCKRVAEEARHDFFVRLFNFFTNFLRSDVKLIESILGREGG